MCGICGKLYFDRDRLVDPALIKKMMDSLYHRGPDEEGTYISKHIGLGHTRLSIIDLSTGKQPISNEDGTIWVVYNGEIYNYRELRSHLIGKGHVFKTETDTEVIVHLYEEYQEGFLSKLRGMFAFALWDEEKKVLLLARDRIGIKPLYYCLTSKVIIFASEIKAILEDTSVRREVNLPIIDRFLTFFYVPGTDTLMKNIYKLNPGYYLTIKNGKVALEKYWDIDFSTTTTPRRLDELKQQLVHVLRESVRIHMIADVPVGFLLSGGIDSTALLSFATEETNKTISTFTIGFEGHQFADERHYGRLAAEQFGTKHYDMTITYKEFLDFLPRYVWHMEEPVCEPPAIALYYISKLAREHVKVLISGEGGDEAFAGYQNYRNLIWFEKLKEVAKPFDKHLSALFVLLSYFTLLRKFKRYAPFVSIPLEDYYYSRTSNPSCFFNHNYNRLYAPHFKHHVDKMYSTEPTRNYFENFNFQHILEKMLYIDTKTWLPDDLLIKADKITMANSIELRVPLLDHEVLEFAASLPSSYKVKGAKTKYILKKAFHGRIPKQIINRRKTGFPVPYESWLRKELRDYVCGILLDKTTINRGYFDQDIINQLVKGNSEYQNYSSEIFSLLTLELWHRAFIDT